MAWFVLFLSTIFDAVGVVLLKASDFEKVHIFIISLLFFGVSFALLCFSIRTIPIGVGFAIWSGISTILIVASGVVFFEEQLGVPKLILLGLIIIGTVGLKLYET